MKKKYIALSVLTVAMVFAVLAVDINHYAETMPTVPPMGITGLN